MSRKRTTGPTDREAEILAILWETGQSDVEEIRQQLKKKPSANTVRTLLSIMTERGLVQDDGTVYGRKYRALVSKIEVQRSVLRKLVDTFFTGSAEEVVLRLVDEGEVDVEKLVELQKRLCAK